MLGGIIIICAAVLSVFVFAAFSEIRQAHKKATRKWTVVYGQWVGFCKPWCAEIEVFATDIKDAMKQAAWVVQQNGADYLAVHRSDWNK